MTGLPLLLQWWDEVERGERPRRPVGADTRQPEAFRGASGSST